MALISWSEKALGWHDTPIPMLVSSVRFHRRIYRPGSELFTAKLLRYTYSDWVAGQSLLADKLAVRQYVEQRVGPGSLPALYAVASRAEDIKIRRLPDRFYLKTNHGCGFNIAVPDKSQLWIRDAKRRMDRFLETDFSQLTGERQYRDIVRKVYAEEFLDLSQPRCMMLRLFCFDDVVAFIQVDTASDRSSPTETSFYLPDWTPAPFRFGRSAPHVAIDRPANLGEVLAMASALSKGLPFVRVDLYWLDGRIVFSELTLTPARGRRRLLPTKYDREIGRQFHLPAEPATMWLRRALRAVKAQVRVRGRHEAKRIMGRAMKAEGFWSAVHSVLGLQRPYRRRSVPLADLPRTVTHVIVPGAGVRRDGTVTLVLRERLDRAIEIARARPDVTIIVSGDGRKAARREDRAMKADLVAHGIAADRVLTDPRGYATLQTMDRARSAGVRVAVIATNDFHEARAVYLATSVGIDAYVVSNPSSTAYADADRPLRYDERRELLAHLKDAAVVQRRRAKRVARRLRR